MLAKINGVFRLTRDVELKYLNSGQAMLNLCLVCSEKFQDKETTLFIDAVAFGKPAEVINQYSGSKGSQIVLSGKLRTEKWLDNNNQNRSKISMTIESFEFVGVGRIAGSHSPTRDISTQGKKFDLSSRYDDPHQFPQQSMDYDGNIISRKVPSLDTSEDDIPF